MAINMISKKLNGIYQNTIAKDKNLKSIRLLCNISAEIREYMGWGAGENETVHCPVQSADHHPKYCVIGTES